MVKRTGVLNSQVMPGEARELPLVCLNPEVAGRLGIKEGDHILLESTRDTVEAEAKLSDRTRKDSVEFFPSVWKDDGGGINRLREAVISDIGPTAAVNETRITVRKA